MDYNATVNLPKTDFPMRAGLPKREPEMLARWLENKLYDLTLERNADKPLYILHDGPPFSNNDIHMGTALNKILKDFVLRHKSMTGYLTPYVPGWDNHGMPIESAIIKKQKLDRKKMSIPEFRDACHAFAQNFVDRHREQFMRLGILGQWDAPYLTMSPEFEAREIKVFGQMAEKGYIYRGLKPVYWCPHDETALAEAEIEYADVPCESIYVKFPIKDDKGLLDGICGKENAYVVIWTTTTWTLPGNMAISLHPALTYVVAEADGAFYLVAKDLLETVAKAAGWENFSVRKEYKGAAWEHAVCRHPFLDRDSLVITGGHVTAESGTGCVHTAPGHGAEDFVACQKYKIPTVVPVDDHGVMTEEAGPVADLYYEKANSAILDILRENNLLLCSKTIQHTYPHCWRCRKPVMFRATRQWFASVDAIKDAAIREVDGITWSPAWGHDRMASMVRERSEWCISRQRHWGLPIPVFFCDGCHKEVITPESIQAVSELFGREGSNAWYVRPASEILPEGFRCPHCSGVHFTKETDTLDGWFDSGSSHDAVLNTDDKLRWPADMYLEGGDQYRGWFQSSLLTAVATTGKAPYKRVVTHGWVVDGEGKKMSKSLGNSIAPSDVLPQFGADVLRLWVASCDYQDDIRVSENILKQLSESYLKIRNTCRFLLANLNGYNPKDALPLSELLPLDRYALHTFNELVGKVRTAYEDCDFHVVYHAVYNYCVVDLSNFYLDIIKDRLYCEKPDSAARLSALTAMHHILEGLTLLITPILAYTSDEIWLAHTPAEGRDARAALLNDMPNVDPALSLPAEDVSCWETLTQIRSDVNKALEDARNAKVIGKSLEAAVTLTVSAETRTALEGFDLPMLLIVSKVTLVSGEANGVTVEAAPGGKCVRCWGYFSDLGTHPEHPELCPRCTAAILP